MKPSAAPKTASFPRFLEQIGAYCAFDTTCLRGRLQTMVLVAATTGFFGTLAVFSILRLVAR
jgi:hypothetical protein